MNISPRSFGSASASSRKRAHSYHHPRRGNILHGKVWLILSWCSLVSTDALFYMIVPDAAKTRILGQLISSVLMNSFLSGGIWFRQNWCRYIYIVILFFRAFVGLILLPDLFMSKKADNVVMTVFILNVLVSVAVASALIVSRDIKRLSNRLLD